MTPRTLCLAALLVASGSGLALAQGTPGAGTGSRTDTSGPSSTGAMGQSGTAQRPGQGAGHDSLTTGTTGSAGASSRDKPAGSATGAGEPGAGGR